MAYVPARLLLGIVQLPTKVRGTGIHSHSATALLKTQNLLQQPFSFPPWLLCSLQHSKASPTTNATQAHGIAATRLDRRESSIVALTRNVDARAVTIAHTRVITTNITPSRTIVGAPKSRPISRRSNIIVRPGLPQS